MQRCADDEASALPAAQQRRDPQGRHPPCVDDVRAVFGEQAPEAIKSGQVEEKMPAERTQTYPRSRHFVVRPTPTEDAESAVKAVSRQAGRKQTELRRCAAKLQVWGEEQNGLHHPDGE